MSAAADLLDRVREACSIPSDNALSQRLGVTRAVVSTWRSGLSPMPDERIAQLSALGKLDGPTWIALIHAERAQSTTERALWRLMLDRLSAAAAVLVLVVFSAPGVARAKAVDSQGFFGSSQPHSVYYVQIIMAATSSQPRDPGNSTRLTAGSPASTPLNQGHTLSSQAPSAQTARSTKA